MPGACQHDTDTSRKERCSIADDEAQWDRLAQHLQALTGATGEMAREVRALVQGLAADRAVFRETLRDLSGFVATAGIAMERLERQVQRLAETTEVGFAETRTVWSETSRQMAENNRLIGENNRLIGENNRLIVENNAFIRRLLEILARGRGDGQGLPQ